MSISLHYNTYMPITLHSTGFGGDNMSLFDFLDACLFGHPVYFDYQDFFTLDYDILSFPSDFFIPTYS